MWSVKDEIEITWSYKNNRIGKYSRSSKPQLGPQEQFQTEDRKKINCEDARRRLLNGKVLQNKVLTRQ